MKKSLFTLTLIAGAVLMIGTGCTSIETNRIGSQVQVKMPVWIKPTITTKDQVIRGSATVHTIFGIFTWGPRSQVIGVNYGTGINSGVTLRDPREVIARNAAAYNATTSAKADIILAPQYVLTIDNYFFYKSINCKVKGFPGFIKGVKVVDLPCMKAPTGK